MFGGYMENNEIISFLERMEDRIMDYKLQIPLFKKYCDFIQELYKKNIDIDYLKYLQLLDDANVIKPTNQEEMLTYQYYKGNLKALLHKLENEKSK